jgi:hypothetical protein
VGDERLIATRMADAPAGKEELTPLQRVIDRVLRYLMFSVAVITAFLLTQYFRLDLGVPTDVFNEVISIVFSIAPASVKSCNVVPLTTS